MSTIPPNGLPTVLTPGGSSPTILTKSEKSDVGALTLLSSMAQTNERLMQKQIEAVSAKYTADHSSNMAEADNWRRTSRKIGEATSFLSETAGRVRQMLSQVDSLISTVNKAGISAGTDPSTNFDGYASAFDSMVRGLSDKAEKGRANNVNLLGRGEPSYSYQTSPAGQTAWVLGGYLGSDYSITDDDGHKWVPDRESRLLRQYDLSTGDELQAVSMRSGLEVISHDTGTGALSFAIDADTVDRHEYTNATISRTGMKLMDAWLYDGLETDAGRTAALDDLYRVKATLELEMSRYEGARVMAAFYEGRANANASASKAEANEALLARAEAVKEVQEDFARKFESTRNTVLGAMQIRQKFLDMFGASSGLTKSLLDFHI